MSNCYQNPLNRLDYFSYNLVGARYYDADIGLWTSVDPMRQFWSGYSYSPNPINGVDPNGMWFGDASSVEGGVCSDEPSAGISGYQGQIDSEAHMAFLEGWDLTFGNDNKAILQTLTKIKSLSNTHEHSFSGKATDNYFKITNSGTSAHADMNYKSTDEFGAHSHTTGSQMSVNVWGRSAQTGKLVYRGDLIHSIEYNKPLLMINSNGGVYYTNPYLAREAFKGGGLPNANAGQVKLGNIP